MLSRTATWLVIVAVFHKYTDAVTRDVQHVLETGTLSGLVSSTIDTDLAQTKVKQALLAETAKVEKLEAQQRQILVAQQAALNELLAQQRQLRSSQESLELQQKQLQLREAAAAADLSLLNATVDLDSSSRQGASLGNQLLDSSHGAAPAPVPAGYIPPWRPIEPPNTTVDDFPDKPPLTLKSEAAPLIKAVGPTLGHGPIVTFETGLRMERHFVTLSGRRDSRVADLSGKYLYAAHMAYWSLHSHSYFYEANGRKLAVFRKTLLALRRVFEVAVYEPICPTQQPQEEHDVGDVPLYPFARVTKWIATFTSRWTVERYTCDGSLIIQYEIKSRYLFSMTSHYDIDEEHSTLPIGTIDQPNLFEATTRYDLWLAKGVDMSFIAALAVMLDLNGMAGEQKPKDKKEKDDKD